MKRLIGTIRALLSRHRPSRTEVGVTAVEYEAICLITDEGGAAYARARQQAYYCRARGSESGFRFWSAVATEVDRRAGASAKSTNEPTR